MDKKMKLGLDGLHITSCDLGSKDDKRLKEVRAAAKDHGLYLEYNFSLNENGLLPSLLTTLLTHLSEQQIQQKLRDLL
ncbi:hypothetical protein QBE52_15880 [Clostridiaceae bacterium 35-E11]